MKIAFAGFRHGHIFSLYEEALNNSDTEIVGCFEADTEAKRSAEGFGVSFAYSSYDELLADTHVDVVAIGDYFGIRGEMVIKALRAGKHVICDKPICTKISELCEIERLSEEKSLVVGCMLDLRFMNTMRLAKEMIQKGDIGKVLNASFTGQHCLNYGKRPTWYFEDGKHGGTINDIAIHGVDIVRFITGKNLTKVCYAETKNAFATEAPGFKDMAHFVCEFDEMTLMADVSYSAPPFEGRLPTYWSFCFWGTEGMILIDYSKNELHLYKEKESIVRCEPNKIDHLSDLMLQINGKHSLMSTKDVLLSQRQVLTIQEASKI